MSEEVVIDSAALRAGGAALDDSVSQLAGQLQTLTGSEPAWGADDISQLCKMVYDAIVEVINESSGGVGGTWAQHGENLRAAADAHDANEQANADVASGMS